MDGIERPQQERLEIGGALEDRPGQLYQVNALEDLFRLLKQPQNP